MKCQPNQVCKVVKGKATCQCPEYRDCGYTPAPVCGSDGTEYPTECHLKVKSCLAASQSGGLVVLNNGKCGTLVSLPDETSAAESIGCI